MFNIGVKQLQIVLTFTFVLYSVQLLSPLRLTGDSIELLSIASSAAGGSGFLNNGHKSHYLPGYPAMVAALERLNLASPSTLVGLNEIFLIIGLIGAYYIGRRYLALTTLWSLSAVFLSCMSFVFVKHFTLPLTDLPFVGISFLALSLLVAAEKEPGPKYYLLWAAACVFSALAIVVRPIGIAMIPALAYSVGTHLRIRHYLRMHRGWLVGSLLATISIGCGGLTVVLRSKYVHEAMAVFASGGVIRSLSKLVVFRVREIGELLINVPYSQLRALSPLVWVTGALAIALTLRYVRPSRFGTLEIYIATYLCILLIWPYGDTRFWIPIVPLLSAEVVSILEPWSWRGTRRVAGITYAAIYVFAGILAMSYSTLITFAGHSFPERYGDNNLRSTYRLFYGYSNVDRSKVDDSVLALLRHYSRHSSSNVPLRSSVDMGN